jgi:hypothetical protein
MIQKNYSGFVQCCEVGAGTGAGGAAPFYGAGARPKKFRLRLRSQVCKFIKNVTKPKFFILKFEVEFKNHNFVVIYFKEPFDDHLCL